MTYEGPVDSSSEEVSQEVSQEAEDASKLDISDWKRIANQAFEDSTTYMETNYSRKWRRSVANTNNQHPFGSIYTMGSYDRRAKFFRPKTLSARKHYEEAQAVAFFSNEDVVDVVPQDETDNLAAKSAKVNHFLLNYRLTSPQPEGLPWFKILQGAGQDAWTYGAVFGKVEWITKEGVVDVDLKGEPIIGKLIDGPAVFLAPPENMRVDPACDWLDPVGSSPYLIQVIPMYVSAVRDYIEDGGTPGDIKWQDISSEDLVSSSKGDATDAGSGLRREREGRGQTDPAESNSSLNPYKLVWVREIIMRHKGIDWIFWMAGTEHMLTEPVELWRVYPDGRPWVFGNLNINTHKVIPMAVAESAWDTQGLANRIANQRVDNVEQAMNGRMLVKREADLDMQALRRNVSGGIIQGSKIGTDQIRELKVTDVTSSAYMEQDRINGDFDDITSTMSQGSIASNRSMNETVGGMQMLASGADAGQEYMIRTFTETFAEPILAKLIKLTQRYETNLDTIERALKVANMSLDDFGGREEFNEELYDAFIKQPLQTSVNVGFNATSPQKRMDRLLMPMTAIYNFMNDEDRTKVNKKELFDEIMGAAGNRNSSRFFNFPDEEEEGEEPTTQEQIDAALAQFAEQFGLKEQELKDREIAIKEGELSLKADDSETKRVKVDNDYEVDMTKIEVGQTEAEKEQELGVAKLEFEREGKEQDKALDIGLLKREGVDPGQQIGD